MKHLHRAITGSLFASIVVLILALAATPPPTLAHSPDARACTLAWEQAPAGSKWEAKQRCIAAQRRHTCIVHPRPVPRSVRVKDERANANQRHVIGWIVREALRRDAPRKVAITALATTTQESKATELRGGDGTSAGPFQLIDLHGSVEQRRTIEFSGTWFYNGVMKSYRRNPHQSIVDLAHSVQRSRHPAAVGQWVGESTATLNAVLGPCRLRPA